MTRWVGAGKLIGAAAVIASGSVTMAGAAVGDILVLPATAAPSGPFITQAEVLKSVQAAQDLKAVPSDLRPSLSNTTDQAEPGFGGNYQCGSARPNKPDVPSYAFGGCTYGDLEGKKLMVAYGDSHAGMWGEALQYIALREGWRLVTFYLPGCPAPDLRFISWTTNSPNTQCNLFHESAPAAIDKLHPQVVVVTSEAGPQQVKRNVMATGAQWEAGWSVVIRSLQQKGTRVVMIGDIPQWDNDDADCLSAHMGDVQACAAPPSVALAPNVSADESAARETNISYISPAPWICAKECEPVVDGMRVYLDQYHLTATYVAYLSGALQGELPLGNG